MIVVDTTVWIDYLAGRGDQSHVVELQRLVDQDCGVAITDVILTEILQGLRTDSDVRRVEDRLQPFPVLRLVSLADYRRAASLYRDARRRGQTIRKTVDCLIAAVCVRENVPLLHNDRDFDHLSQVTALMIHPVRR
jgi:predicted nucleic acid-binding protein